MNKNKLKELFKHLMYLKFNHGYAEESPFISWDEGVNKAIHDLFASKNELERFNKGYLDAMLEYVKFINQKDPKKYVQDLEDSIDHLENEWTKSCTRCD